MQHVVSASLQGWCCRMNGPPPGCIATSKAMLSKFRSSVSAVLSQSLRLIHKCITPFGRCHFSEDSHAYCAIRGVKLFFYFSVFCFQKFHRPASFSSSSHPSRHFVNDVLKSCQGFLLFSASCPFSSDAFLLRFGVFHTRSGIPFTLPRIFFVMYH